MLFLALCKGMNRILALAKSICNDNFRNIILIPIKTFIIYYYYSILELAILWSCSFFFCTNLDYLISFKIIMNFNLIGHWIIIKVDEKEKCKLRSWWFPIGKTLNTFNRFWQELRVKVLVWRINEEKFKNFKFLFIGTYWL